jgi:hypothetical protein
MDPGMDAESRKCHPHRLWIWAGQRGNDHSLRNHGQSGLRTKTGPIADGLHPLQIRNLPTHVYSYRNRQIGAH